MPTYEYTCQKCDHAFEWAQSMTASALATCPREVCPQKKWGKGKVKRGIGGGAGLIFKGSGFYITDYRSEGYKSAEKKDSGPSTPSAAAAPATAATPAAASTSGAPTAASSGGGSVANSSASGSGSTTPSTPKSSKPTKK